MPFPLRLCVVVESSVLSKCLSTLRYCLKVTDCLGAEAPGRGRECLSSPSPDHALGAVPQVVKEGRKQQLLLLGAKGAGGHSEGKTDGGEGQRLRRRLNPLPARQYLRRDHQFKQHHGFVPSFLLFRAAPAEVWRWAGKA